MLIDFESSLAILKFILFKLEILNLEFRESELQSRGNNLPKDSVGSKFKLQIPQSTGGFVSCTLIANGLDE